MNITTTHTNVCLTPHPLRQMSAELTLAPAAWLVGPQILVHAPDHRSMILTACHARVARPRLVAVGCRPPGTYVADTTPPPPNGDRRGTWDVALGIVSYRYRNGRSPVSCRQRPFMPTFSLYPLLCKCNFLFGLCRRKEPCSALCRVAHKKTFSNSKINFSCSLLNTAVELKFYLVACRILKIMRAKF